MSHDRCYALIPESAFERGRPNKAEQLRTWLSRPHHAMPHRLSDRLHQACQDALPDLFSGARLPGAQRAVEQLFYGDTPLHRLLRVEITGDIPRGLHGFQLAAAQEVLRALRPSRIPGLDEAMRVHHARVRVLLKAVDPGRMRWVTWVAM